jgi:hypothetical protein
MHKILLFALALFSHIGLSQVLTNGTTISITKTWPAQPNGYTYPISIKVPPGPVPAGGFPVCILIHGNGSANLSILAGPPMLSQQQFGSVLPCHILVAPTGYQNSWNICAENSDAPDVEMIGDLVSILQTYTANVNPAKIRILGTSNGAGLANRVFIENTNTGIDIVCPVVSHLNDFQYHSANFYKPGGVTNPGSSYCGYDVVSAPLASRKYLSISNVNDPLIPYFGGFSPNIGATFLPAETSAFLKAIAKGYSGSVLTSGTTIGTGILEITEFSYLSGDVVHLKGSAAHQANATQKNYIKSFFSDCAPTVGMDENTVFEITVYPNPSNHVLNIRTDASTLHADYALHDHLGKKLLVGKIESENTRIDVATLPKGIYFLRVGGHLKYGMRIGTF